jgi:hypothetical protein
MNPSVPLPAALVDALSSGQLLIFCGAGISMLPPSSLPDWWSYNQSILEVARRLTLEQLPNLPETAVQSLRDLSLDKLNVGAFSDVLVQSFAGPYYFPLLTVLESDQPNANHKALAELAKRGIVRHIVTTNFDTLIEQSFHQAHCPLHVLATVADFEQPIPAEGCVLYKIHGSVTTTASLVDTITQKVRGLPPAIKARLQHLFQQQHVLVLGYSGADLQFSDDYLAFEAIPAYAPGLTWVVRRGSTPSARVQALLDGLGERAHAVQDELPDFFAHLGLAVDTPAPAHTDVRAAANARARTQIESFLKDQAVSSAAFCMNLVYQIGPDDGQRYDRGFQIASTDGWRQYSG